MVAPANTRANAEAMERGDIRTLASLEARVANREYANEDRLGIVPSKDEQDDEVVEGWLILLLFLLEVEKNRG